ncbi:MAG: hypothetical protein H8D23_04980 [Candidatus Brocadiales bacterium]|nr:hypothetical protein [Candidatus Brocadiales bacterium]
MILKHSNLNLSDKEPFVLLMVLVEARKEKMLEFKESLDPDVLEEIHMLRRLIKKVFKLATGEKVLPSAN